MIARPFSTQATADALLRQQPALALIGLMTIFMIAFALLRGASPAGATTVTVALPHVGPLSMLTETSGAGTLALRGTGEQARLINAALPFADVPPQPAPPFHFHGSDADKRLALTCLTQAVYFEAGAEPLDGERAVAQVVLNRVRHPAFPKSVCGVVYQGAESSTCQFSFVCDGSLDRVPAREPWRRAQAVALAALSGSVAPMVGEATHYHADYVAPAWAPLLFKVQAIGQHIFYRWPGAWGERPAFRGRYAGEPRDPLTLRLAEVSYDRVNGEEAPWLLEPPVDYNIKDLLEGSAERPAHEEASSVVPSMNSAPAPARPSAPTAATPVGTVTAAAIVGATS